MNSFNYFCSIFLATVLLTDYTEPARPLTKSLHQVVELAASKYTNVLIQNPTSEGNYPHTGHPDSPYWDDTTNLWGWTAGFYPGVLWQLYRLTNDSTWSDAAVIATETLRPRENDTGTHDVGFVIMSSFGLGLASGFGSDETSRWQDVVVQAAHTLSTRFVANAGVIRSWNSGEPGEVTVIVDNMMNLDLLFTAAAMTGNDTFVSISLSHADKTVENHFRPDASTYHVVGYSDKDGSVTRKYTAQGYADNSTWSRGQAWALYGYIETYEWTKLSRYLEMAQRATDLFISRLPSDWIPYWDFDAGELASSSYQPRDTSAASIAAMGMLKLYKATGNEMYLNVSEAIVGSLLENYSGRDWAIPAVSINGTVFKNEGKFDTAIIYGDFYLLKYVEEYFGLQ